MLELQGVSAAYGPVKVLHGVDVRVNAGEVVTLILPADVSWTDGEAGAVQSAAASAQPSSAACSARRWSASS